MELHREGHITCTGSSPSYTKEAAPPLPHRLPNNTSPLPPYKPTPNPSPPPPSLPPRKPTNVPSYPSSPRTSANFSSNPALQKAAFNAANDPSIHSPTTRGPGFHSAAYGAASTSTQKRVSGALASNPAFQKAAAADSRVQSTSVYATRDVGVPKAVHGPVTAHFGASTGQSRTEVVAIADFDASEPDDLPLRTGDVVTVTEDIDDNWYRGELKNGRRGMFPKNFVELKK
ncbi:SH3 domain-containing protein [Chytriomyces cf. hyalinus JEL632]|nr:SH3 domain-containing protein [Chytriomyces cf. hyalinus JEL632]